MILRSATFAELDTTTLYALLKLRSEVFVVEQDCAYLDPDGRDTEPGTRHLWLVDEADGTGIAAYLRVLDDGAEARIGRVVVAPHARGAGHASTLMEHALAMIGGRPSTLDAQAHLLGFYGRYGYVPSGPEYLDDGIPHVPMTRP